jgi:DNA-binding transcriptional regulator YiaG
MAKHIPNDEFRERVKYYHTLIFHRKMTKLATVASHKIAALLDEVHHLLIDYTGGVPKSLNYQEVLGCFSDEEWSSMSNNKKHFGKDLVEKENKRLVSDLSKLVDVCKTNNAYIEKFPESSQDKLCMLAEIEMRKIDFRKEQVVDESNLCRLIANERNRMKLSSTEFAKKVGTSVQKIAEIEDGHINRVKGLEEYVNKIMAEQGLKVEVLFRVDTIDGSSGTIKLV